MFERLWPIYVELLRLGWDAAGEQLGVDLGPFSLANENVQRIKEQLAQRVKDIDETTRTLIQDAIANGLDAGQSIAEIAETLKASIPDRAELVARTETATAFETANHLGWRESGVVGGVTWLLGPEPCPECQSLGGKTVPLGDEFAPGVHHPPLHPRCTCASAPELL